MPGGRDGRLLRAEHRRAQNGQKGKKLHFHSFLFPTSLPVIGLHLFYNPSGLAELGLLDRTWLPAKAQPGGD
jgi:hypothetical protein